jgi:ABC-type lipoprotein export system ATPase subunit
MTVANPKKITSVSLDYDLYQKLLEVINNLPLSQWVTEKAKEEIQKREDELNQVLELQKQKEWEKAFDELSDEVSQQVKARIGAAEYNRICQLQDMDEIIEEGIKLMNG